MKKLLLIFAFSIGIFTTSAQDDLVNKLKFNKTDNNKFQFTVTKNVENTDVKAQGSSGTCWSYSVSSYLESEMMRMGKKPIDLAEIFTARNSYVERAKQYLLWNGLAGWGDGAELHDAMNSLKKYGIVPQEVYSGLQYGAVKNDFDEMQNVLKSMLDAMLKNPNGKLSPANMKAFEATIDSFLGEVPKEFIYEGKKFTPQSFAKEVVGINPDDYVNLSSYLDYPYYSQFVLPVPDNWSKGLVYNIKMNELTEVIDYAISKGFSVAWATDVSEPYFSWKNGVAYVPNIDLSTIDPKNNTLFDELMPDKTITEEMRQDALNNLLTTDDHGMHVVGFAKDQTGKDYYLVKNSWGKTNDFQGYLYVTKPYVQYKTTAILIHKDGIPQHIRKKLNL